MGLSTSCALHSSIALLQTLGSSWWCSVLGSLLATRRLGGIPSALGSLLATRRLGGLPSSICGPAQPWLLQVLGKWVSSWELSCWLCHSDSLCLSNKQKQWSQMIFFVPDIFMLRNPKKRKMKLVICLGEKNGWWDITFPFLCSLCSTEERIGWGRIK